MKRVDIPEQDLERLEATLDVLGLTPHHRISPTTISISRDAMTNMYPGDGEEYYARVTQVLRVLTPSIHWMAEGKDDDVGFFTAYQL